MAKELVPIVLSCAVWGPSLAKMSEFQCDNLSLVSAINKGTAKDTLVMHLLHCLWFFTALFDIDVTASHIAGVNNETADMLSRNHVENFRAAHPSPQHHCHLPCCISSPPAAGLNKLIRFN